MCVWVSEREKEREREREREIDNEKKQKRKTDGQRDYSSKERGEKVWELKINSRYFFRTISVS